LLEFSTTIDEVALHVGYDDARGFRRAFRNIIGLTPSDYRRRFSQFGAGATPK
jgi:AraC-like DNA-binding protein